jgi:hypothetical protein
MGSYGPCEIDSKGEIDKVPDEKWAQLRCVKRYEDAM